MFRNLPSKRLVVFSAIIVSVIALFFFRSGFVSEANTSLLPPVTATKTVVDVAGTIDGNADPGDTLEYTVTVNNGAGAATGLVMSDPLAGPQTLVPGSFNIVPVARADSYNAVGNVRMVIPPANSVLTNDNDYNGGALTVTTLAPVSTQGVTVALAADGSFTYNPPRGFGGVGATDTFSYTISDGQGSTATGTVTITVSTPVWFINAAAAGGGDGRFLTPYNSLATFQGVNNGTGTNPAAGDVIFIYSGAYVAPLTLLSGQIVIGQGASGSILGITGIVAASGTSQIPVTTVGTNPTLTSAGVGITLNAGNTIRGITIGNVGTAVGNAKIFGSGFGTLTLGNSTTPDITLSGTGAALNLTTGTFAATSALSSLTTTSANAQGISLAGIAGTVSFGSTTVSGQPSQCILVGTSTANISFGNTSCTGGTDSISLQNNSGGTRTFGTLSITNGTGDSFVHAVGGGTTTVSGLATLTNPGSNCIDIQDSTTAVTFANVNCTGSAAAGVFLDDNSGAVTFGDLDIDTDANVRAFQATAGNTGTITTTSGTIADTGTAIAVDIVGTSAASTTPLNMQLTSVSATGGTNGIILQHTSGSGSPGGFRILGDGTGFANGSGGIIQNIAPNGSPSTLGNNPVWLTTVSGTISLTSMSMSIANNTFSGMHVDNNAGGNATVNITGCTFTGVGGAGNTGQNKALLQFEAGGSANVTANVQNSFFFNNRTYGMFATAAGTSIMQVTVNQSGFGTNVNTGAPVNNPGTTITNAPPFSLGITNGSSAQVDYDVTNNTFWGGRGLDGAIYAVTISGASTTAGSHLSGFFTGNKIGKAGTTSSGCANGCAALGLLPGTGGTFNTTVSNNDIRQVNSVAVNLKNSVTAASGNAIAHFTNNVITEPDTTGSPAFQRGLVYDIGNSGGAALGGCLEATNNNITGAWQAGNFIRITTNNTTGTLVIPGLSPASGASAAQINTYIQSLNPLIPAGSVNTTVGTGPINGGAACTPTPFAPPADEKAANRIYGFDNRLDLLNTPFSIADLGMRNEANAEFRMLNANPKSEIENPKSEGTLVFTRVSALIGELAGKLGENISPTVYAQEKGKPAAPATGETVTSLPITLPANETVIYKFKVTVDNGPYASGLDNITNTATVSGSNFTTVSPNSSFALDAAPDLQVTVSDSNTTTQPGAVLAYTTTYQNNTAINGQNAGAVRISQTVPINTTFNATVSGPGWSCPDGSPAMTTCTFDVGAVNAGAPAASLNFALNILPLLSVGATQISDTATIAENPLNANGNDRVPANNSSSDTTNIIGNWLGTTSTVWETNTNWSNGVLPPTGNNISIPNAANQPVLASSRTINLLTLNKNLSIGSGFTLTATGNVMLGTNIVDGLGTLELGTASAISRGPGGQVNSTLKKNFGGPGPAFEMPTGTTGAFSPLNVTVTNGSGQLTARANTGMPVVAPVPLNAARTLQRYWTLSGSGIRSNIIFNYLTGDVPGAPNNEGIWNIIRITGNTAVRYAPSAEVVMNAAANTFTFNGLESYSDWTAGEPLAPTAANAGVSGRVLNSEGRGVAGAIVEMSGQNGGIMYAPTNPFGYYRFVNIPAGQSYVISVRSKRFTFAPRVVTVNDDIAGVDFTPEP